MNSLVIPVYRNEANLDRLLAELVKLARSVAGEFEVVFVVDGSPDRCLQILRERLPALPLRTQLLSLSRNFGFFAAIAAGLERARGAETSFFVCAGCAPRREPISSSESADVDRTRGFPKFHRISSGSSTAN